MFELMNNNYMNSYNPFRAMDEFERHAFHDFFGNQSLAEFKTDITDEGDRYVLEADLPGFEKKDIDLSVQGDLLTIRAERHSKVEEKDQKNKMVRMERSYGAYSRQFDVSGIDVNSISAKYEDGVLKLDMPKRQQNLPEARTLAIE